MSRGIQNDELICIRLFKQLRCIIERNIQNIFQYSNKRDPTKDIKVKRLVKGNNLRVRLILNTDGAIVRNSVSESAYTVWVAIADLPPVLRSKFEDIVLCILRYGTVEAPWTSIFQHYKNEPNKTFEVSHESVLYFVQLETIFLLPISSAKVMCYKWSVSTVIIAALYLKWEANTNFGRILILTMRK